MSVDQQIFQLMDDPFRKEAGFKLLMNSYQKDLYWHIKGIVTTHEDTDDVLQNTLIKVYRHFDSFKRDANLYTWMYRIATNESFTFLKKNNNKKTVGLDDSLEIVDYNGMEMNGEEIKSKLEQLVNILPEKQRIVFNMRYFQEMPYKEMSDLLETSESALKASYHFAVKKIEAQLKA